jgi:hypothetical protein
VSGDGTLLEQLRAALAEHPAVSAVTINASATLLDVMAHSPSGQWQLTMLPNPRGELPIIGILGHRLIGSLAHVSHDGTVCVSDNEGLSIDVARPADVAVAALTDALAVLEKSLTDLNADNLTDLHDEFEGYWESLPGVSRTDVHFPLDENTRKVQVFIEPGKGCVSFTDFSQLKGSKYGAIIRLRNRSDLARTEALYVPLQLPVLPPSPGNPLSTNQVQKWLTLAVDPDRVAQVLKSWPRRVFEAYVVFSQPRSEGISAFGVRFNSKGGRHPLLESSGWAPRPLVAQRHAASHLRVRGGAANSLSKAHVAIIGCGSVGSRISEQLAQSGVGKLTLVDPDVFKAENIYRHVLGGECCGYGKASALKVHLQYRLPQIDIEAVHSTLAKWATIPNLQSVSGIAIAIGKPHDERTFIKTLWNQEAMNLSAVTTWLEPLGIGGHSQLTVPRRAGCLECLYTKIDGNSRLTPKTAFTVPDQKVSRNLTGCAGAFTPYSALDATQTALMATRQLVAALLGENSPSYAAWCGSDAAFRKAGLQATDWYHRLSEHGGAAATIEYSRVKCPVCGGTS